MNHLAVPFRCLLGLAFAALLAIDARAAVTNVAWYRLGENDPGGNSGLAVTNTTTDLAGTKHLKQFGSPFYTNAVSSGASNRVGSSLAVQFNGASQCLSNAVVSTATDNFGIEAWVRPGTTAGAGVSNYFIAYNGNTTANGWGIFQNGNRYFAQLAGLPPFGVGVSAAAGTWAHVALVRDNGTTTFYVNGIVRGSTVSAPATPVGGFAIGSVPESPTSQYFNGAIDEVRVFTFAPGQFNTNDLLLNLQRVATLPSASISPPNATLNGNANAAGLPTTTWFEWGITTNYGNVTPPQAFGSGSANFSRGLTGLTADITYNFRAVASNSLGVVPGTNQSFTCRAFLQTAAGLPGLALGAAAWGDSDNDGRLDLLLVGNSGGTVLSDVWRNTVSGFTRTFAGLTGVTGDGWPGAVAWGDYNNDGWLDIALAGTTTGLCCDDSTSEVWANTHPGFSPNPFSANFPKLISGTVKWTDFDNSGQLDLMLAGFALASGYHCDLWQYISGSFINSGLALPPFEYGNADWGDYDNDGRKDLLLVGRLTGAQLLRHTSSSFTNLAIGLPFLVDGSAAWCDYDNDGWLDFLINGRDGAGPVSQLWRNTGSTFTHVPIAGLPGVTFSSVAWGDFDNDGRPDFVITGTTNDSASGVISQVWRNTGSGFTNLAAGLPGVFRGAAVWGDYDNDGSLDLAVMGSIIDGSSISRVYRNQASVTTLLPPALPSAPSGLTATYTNGMAVLSWNAATDTATPAAGLTYNVRAGTVAGGTGLISPQSATNGFRRLPAAGNAQMRRFTLLRGLNRGETVHWSAQAVDTSFTGGPFATEAKFTFGPFVETRPPLALGVTTFSLRAQVNPDATTAWFEWGTTTNLGFITPTHLISGASGYTNINHILSGLTVGTVYYFRAAASNNLGIVYGDHLALTPSFVAAVTNLPGVTLGSVAWGDYDNDGRLDLLLAGNSGSGVLSDVWRNTGSGFTRSFAGLTGVTGDFWPGSAAWGDYNNDGWLDVLLAGSTNGNFFDAVSELWVNNHPGFARVNSFIGTLPQVVSGAVDWGDYDNDGRLDFVLAGYDDASGYHCGLWRNTSSGFSNVNAQLPPFEYGSAGWGDYDNDGRLDLLATGRGFASPNYNLTALLRNTATGFVSNSIGLPGLIESSVAWGDYDNDGRLDFLLTGYDGGSRISQLWRNTGSTFTNVPIAGLPGVSFGSAAWGDYDSDGRLDFLITGTTNGEAWGSLSEIWRNTGGGFVSVGAGLPGVMRGSAIWGDYDNDGRLDIALTGTSAAGTNLSQVFHNEMLTSNSPPTAPSGLAMTISNGVTLLSWNAATDSATPAAGLSYNVRAGTTPGGWDLISPHSATPNGFRRLPALGNAQSRRFMLLDGLTNAQTVYWNVQAVDTSFAGGPFAAESSFTFAPRLSIVAAGTNVTIAWSPSLPGWMLQQTLSLSPVTWSNAPSGATNPVTVPSASPTKFYRLFKP